MLERLVNEYYKHSQQAGCTYDDETQDPQYIHFLSFETLSASPNTHPDPTMFDMTSNFPPFSPPPPPLQSSVEAWTVTSGHLPPTVISVVDIPPPPPPPPTPVSEREIVTHNHPSVPGVWVHIPPPPPLTWMHSQPIPSKWGSHT